MPRCFIGVSGAALAAAIVIIGIPQIRSTPSVSLVTSRHNISVGNNSRTYKTIRASRTDRRPEVVVFALHGARGSPEGFIRAANLGELATKSNALVVVPRGAGGWHLRSTPGHPNAPGTDLAFLSAVLHSIRKTEGADLPLWIVGISQGGAMGQLWAAELGAGDLDGLLIHSSWLHQNFTPESIRAKHCDVTVVVGLKDNSSRVTAAAECAEAYRRADFETEFLQVEKLGHAWSSRSTKLLIGRLAKYGEVPNPVAQ